MRRRAGRSERPRGAPLLVVLALGLAGCGSAPAQPTGLEGPLTALPACEGPPPATDAAPPEGLVLPPGAVVTGVRAQGPLTQVTGWAPLTPVEVRLFVEGRQDLTPVRLEDEVFEAELLVTDGTRRTYLKALAVCDRGSALDLVVAPESAAAAVPEPAGAPAPR